MNAYWCSGSAYTEFDVGTNDKDPKLKVGDHVKIWKYKNIVTKSYMASKLIRRIFCAVDISNSRL